MILSDRSINVALDSGRLFIDPLDRDAIQPASVDIRVQSQFRVFQNYRYDAIDPTIKQPDLMRGVSATDEEPFIIHPGEFVLASTVEYIKLASDLVARLEGKSSLGRLGLVVHATAGYIDPGFEGHVTLELSNVANLPIKIYPNMKIGQFSFFEMTTPADRPYGTPGLGSKYKGQRGPTDSQMHKNYEEERNAGT